MEVVRLYKRDRYTAVVQNYVDERLVSSRSCCLAGVLHMFCDQSLRLCYTWDSIVSLPREFTSLTSRWGLIMRVRETM